MLRDLAYELYDLDQGPSPYYVRSLRLFSATAIVMTVETIMAVASRSVLAEQKNIILVIAFRHKVHLAFQDYLLHVLPN